MLVKKELEAVPILKFPEISEKHQRKDRFTASAQVVTLKRSGNVLVVDVFGVLKRELKLRFFSDGKNFLVCDKWPADKWEVRKPETVLGQEEIISMQKDDDLAKKFFNFTNSHWKYSSTLGGFINWFAYKLNSDKYQRARQKKYDLMCEHFAMYPVIPCDLQLFCERNVFAHTYIFISKVVKGYRETVCGHCGHKSKIKSVDAASGQLSVCPACGFQAKYRGDWFKSKLMDESKVCVAHRVDGHLLLRWITVRRTFYGSHCEYEFEDYFKTLYMQTSKGKSVYSYKYFRHMMYGYGWYYLRIAENIEETHVYNYNLHEVFGESYHHVNLQEGLANAGKIAFPRLLYNLESNSVTEYLFKLGLSTLAANLGKEKLKKGNNFREVLDINPQYLPLYRKYNVTVNEYLVIQASQTWVSFESFEKFRTLQPDDTDDIIKILKSMSFERFVNYFMKQKKSIKRKLNFLLIQYIDYISMSKALKIDLTRKSIRFPSNIKKAHDTILERYNKVKNEVENEVFKEAVKKLYTGLDEYAKGAFCIVFPKLRSDLITEGQSLNHCVGSDSYYKNHIEGSKMIFFVRKAEEPEKPFFTMELNMVEMRIRQLYGYGGCDPTKEVKKFANDFVNKLKVQRTIKLSNKKFGPAEISLSKSQTM